MMKKRHLRVAFLLCVPCRLIRADYGIATRPGATTMSTSPGAPRPIASSSDQAAPSAIDMPAASNHAPAGRRRALPPSRTILHVRHRLFIASEFE
ncbi:hypothetical protein [Burkholderia sp. BCC0405]|uniref:hypothetical protein n=1 Tax=Burkholderia sp. BCC0405 TaxID=2676298 RepID=UPI001589D16D|nr:hypothetical protein [Burkholderia sp. BCC0405]